MQTEQENLTKSKQIFASILMVLMIILLTCLTYSKTPGNVEITKDAREYVTASYHLFNQGIISQDGIKPSLFREPLPIFILAANMALFTDIPTGLKNVDTLCQTRNYIKQINAVNSFYIFLAFLVMWRLGVQIFRSHRWALLFIFSAWMVFYIQPWYLSRPIPEYCGSLLIMLISSLAFDIIKPNPRRKTLILSIGIGVAIGLLALTKAAVFYIAFIYIPLLSLVYLLNRESAAKQSFTIMALCFAGFSIVTAPWVIRNIAVNTMQTDANTHARLGASALVSSRGGAILLGRAQLNDTVAKDPLGAAYAFSPPYIQRQVFEKMLGYNSKELWERGKYASLNRNIQFKKNKHDTALEAINEDKAVANTQTASKKIINHLDKHFITTGVLIWRGLWSFDGGNHLRPGGKTLFSLVSNFFCFICFISLPLVCLLRKSSALFTAISLPTAIFWFYALFSHFIPHYTAQLIPFMMLCGLLTIKNTLSCVFRGKPL